MKDVSQSGFEAGKVKAEAAHLQHFGFNSLARQQQLVRHFAESEPGAEGRTGRNVGRDNTLPSVFVNSALVTGLGATKFTGPLTNRSRIMKRIAPTTSSSATVASAWCWSGWTGRTCWRCCNASRGGSEAWPDRPAIACATATTTPATCWSPPAGSPSSTGRERPVVCLKPTTHERCYCCGGQIRCPTHL